MLELHWPWALLMLPLPLLVWWLMPVAQQQEAALRVPFFDTFARHASGPRRGRASWIRRGLMIVTWLALVASASYPRYVGDPISLPASGRDLLLAVDISGSMGTEDMTQEGRQTTRLAVVKSVVGDFVERRQGDRLGLILFGTKAYLQTPLTFDRATVRSLLRETPLGIAGGKTAVGDAIGLAVKRLQARPENSRVLILLTDGRSTIGEVEPLQAAKIAAQQGVKIYTIGFGADEMVVPGLLFNRTINPSADLDSKTLTEIAMMTGGIYQRARDASELAAIYTELDRLEPVDQEQELYRPINALFHWPLGLALIISMLLCLSHPQVRSSLPALRRTDAHLAETQP